MMGDCFMLAQKVLEQYQGRRVTELGAQTRQSPTPMSFWAISILTISWQGR